MAGPGLTLEDFRSRSEVEYVDPDTYDGLPVSVQAIVTRKEYQWLSAAEKHRLTQDLTEPDPEP